MSTAPSSILDSSPSTVGCPRISSSTEALTVPAASDKGADEGKEGGGGLDDCHGVCAICLKKITLEETALVKGCEHAYCVTCILVWATYKQNPCCPQCKNPFEFLIVHRSLDGCIHDYMFEETVCLLLKAAWFVPLQVDTKDNAYDEDHDYLLPPHDIEEEEDDLEDTYFVSTSNVRIGNRKWGDNGYVRAGRKQARPVNHVSFQEPGASSSSRNQQHKDKEASKDGKGRWAKRAMKHEAADKAAAAKHEQHLQRLGLK